MKLNKKGFTMVEILAAVTILGILTVVAVVGISRVMDNAKKEYYKNQEENIILAAQSFVQNNTNKLPKNIGQKVKLKLSELTKNKYLKETVKDYGKQNCDMDKSYVEITKISQKEYSYDVILECPSYKGSTSSGTTDKDNPSDKDTPDTEEKEGVPVINIEFDKDKNGKSKDGYVMIKMTGNDRLTGYSYIIYSKKSSASKYTNVKSSGSVEVKSKSTVTLDVNLNSYLPSEIKVQVSATNDKGKSATKTVTKSYNDNKPPTCIFSKNEYTVDGEHVAWSNKGKRVVTIGCIDVGGVGCEKDVYTQAFTEDSKYGIITIRDRAGNETDCKVQTYLDATPPKCTNSGGGTDWTNKNVTLVGTCTDKMSGCKNGTNSGKTTYKNGNVNLLFNTNTNASNISPGTIYDVAGNQTKCSSDRTVKLDLVKPVISSIDNKYNNIWTNKKYTVDVNYSDDFSGIKSIEYSYPDVTKQSWKKYSGFQTTPGKNLKFTTTAFEKERDENASIRVCDLANNCVSKNTRIRIDTTKPDCGTAAGSSKTLKSGVRSIALGCSDPKGTSISNGSGCTENPYNRSFNDTRTTADIEIADKAGNSKKCTVDVYLDNTPPNCPTFTSPTATRTWVKSAINFTFTFTSDTDNWNWFTRTNGGAWASWGNNKASVKTKSITGDGDRTIAVEVFDKYGNKRRCEYDQHYYIDTTGPICGTASGSTTTWSPGTRNISVACSDAGSGCTQGSFSNTFTGSLQTSTIQLKDNLGNTTNCPVNVYLDNIKPTCGGRSNEGTAWSGGSRTVYVGCNDTGGSGCKQSTFSGTYSGAIEVGQSNITISDNANNTNTCSVNVYIDNVKPACPSFTATKGAGGTAISPGMGYNDDIYFYFTFPAGSDVTQFQWHTNRTSDDTWKNYSIYPIGRQGISISGVGKRRVALTIYDRANNTSFCSSSYYHLDKTNPNAPTISSVSPIYNDKGKKTKKANVTVTCSDVKNSSGYRSGIASCGLKGSEVSGKTATITVKKGESYTFRAIDKAGNKAKTTYSPTSGSW